MRQPVYRFLEEFASSDAAPVDRAVLQLRPRVQSPTAAQSMAAAQLGEAYARGYEEGRATVRTEVEGEIVALVSSCEQQLETARRTFAQTVAAGLVDGLHRRLDEMHAAIEEHVLAVLLPVLGHALTEAAVRDIAAGVRGLAKDGGAVRVELSGPQELIELVSRRFGEIAGDGREWIAPPIKLRPAATAEISAEIDGTVIQSRLAEWTARIREAIG
jgi:hypothetical protein